MCCGARLSAGRTLPDGGNGEGPGGGDRSGPSEVRSARQLDTRGDLLGSHQASAAGIVATGHAPVLSLCRRLIEAGIDPDRPLRVYRGDTLALTVRSIAEGARLRIKDGPDGRPRFAPYRAGRDGAESCRDRPPIAQNASEVANPPHEAKNAPARAGCVS
jgi:hypothetical protein